MSCEGREGEPISRKAHLQACREEALRYCVQGDVLAAWLTLRDCLLRHPETQDHNAIFIGTLMLSLGQLSTPEQMRGFIEGVR